MGQFQESQFSHFGHLFQRSLNQVIGVVKSSQPQVEDSKNDFSKC